MIEVVMVVTSSVTFSIITITIIFNKEIREWWKGWTNW